MARPTDLDDASARRATALLEEQRTAYAALLEALPADDSSLPIELDRARAAALAAGRILQSMAITPAALAALGARLRRGDCLGANADALRALWAQVAGQADEAGARYDRLIESLRADQALTLAELRELGVGTTSGYRGSADFCAILVDRSG